MDWTQAGLPGDFPPDGSWKQVGSTIAGCGTSSSPVSPSNCAITTALSACGKNHYVQLAGTQSSPADFYLNASINIPSNCVLRGGGANATRIHFASSGSYNCNGMPAGICIIGSNTYGTQCTLGSHWPCPAAGISKSGIQHEASWIGNYARGSGTIMLDSVTGIELDKTPIVLDQCDVGFSGSSSNSACGAPHSGNMGAVIAAAVWAGGSNYKVGDKGTIHLVDSGWGNFYGSGTATYQVTSSDTRGSVTGFVITNGGYGYTTTQGPGSRRERGGTTTTSTSGRGTGFTIQITEVGSYDNGGLFDCAITMICNYEAASNTSRSARSQSEVVIATNIRGTGPYIVTIEPPTIHANWTSSQAPKAWWGSQTVTNAGVEDMELDQSLVRGESCGSNGGCMSAIAINMAYDVWVTGIASKLSSYYHVNVWVATHFLISNGYFYETANKGTQSYGIGCSAYCSNALLENNIVQGVVDAMNANGTCTGCVFAYNFAVNQDYRGCTKCMLASNAMHSTATDYILEEGNIGGGVNLDGVHGPHFLNTFLRNYFNGYEANNGIIPDNSTVPFIIGTFSRYNNLIGNVLGTAGYHTVYECVPATSTTPYCSFCSPLSSHASESLVRLKDCLKSWLHGGYTDIYSLGWSNSASVLDWNNVPPTPNDPVTASSLMRWGNYDVVNAAVQWNSSEVPSTDPNYPNRVPATRSISPSFYNGTYSAYPSCGTGLNFWKNSSTGSCPPYPPIGPDVTRGDIGMCTSGRYTWSRALTSAQCADGAFAKSVNGGYGNSNPAMRCYLNQMGGPPDGTGNFLTTFNRASCYTKDSSSIGLNSGQAF